MTFPDALGQIASTGLAGAMLVVALLALRAKDRALSAEQLARINDTRENQQLIAAEQTARINDSRENLQLIMKLQEQVILAVNKLSELVEIWEKREAERERAAQIWEKREAERERAAHFAREAGSHSPYRVPGGEKGGT